MMDSLKEQLDKIRQSVQPLREQVRQNIQPEKTGDDTRKRLGLPPKHEIVVDNMAYRIEKADSLGHFNAVRIHDGQLYGSFRCMGTAVLEVQTEYDPELMTRIAHEAVRKSLTQTNKNKKRRSR